MIQISSMFSPFLNTRGIAVSRNTLPASIRLISQLGYQARRINIQFSEYEFTRRNNSRQFPRKNV
jgi:hypothetical protein